MPKDEKVKAILTGKVATVYNAEQCLVTFHGVDVPMFTSQLDAVTRIEDMLINALCTDGAQHKQYYLYRIAQQFGMDVGALTQDKGVAP